MNIEILSLRERPDLIPLVFSEDLQAVWPEFMRHDAAAKLYFGRSIFTDYLDYAFAGLVDARSLDARSVFHLHSMSRAVPNCRTAVGTRLSAGLMKIGWSGAPQRR
jgi:hypothetical protein